MAPAAKLSGSQTIRQLSKSGLGTDRVTQNRDIVKPVLTNPLALAWPTLPTHLQTAILSALPELISPDVSDYHVSRARCSRSTKRARRQAAKRIERVEQSEQPEPEGSAPERPAILDHFVLGLNETIKALENGIASLRQRVAILTDSVDGERFLPTEPTVDSPLTRAPLAYVLVANGSVSPPALIDPLLGYCATYNTLLNQHLKLNAAARSRRPDPKPVIDLAPIRIVPLGRREAEIAAIIGLRRVSCFGICSTHPALERLASLFPHTLKPPLHPITLPLPSTTLHVHDTPVVSYPALHIKAIHTSVPVEANGRKVRRLNEVRCKRVASKLKRREARTALEQKVRKDSTCEHNGGRAMRRAAKASR